MTRYKKAAGLTVIILVRVLPIAGRADPCTPTNEQCLESSAQTTVDNTVGMISDLGAAPQTPPCDVQSNYHDGYSNAANDPNWWEGAAADLVIRKGLVCDQDTNDLANISTAWVMVANNGGAGGYVQSGHLRGWGSAIYHFGEYSRDGVTKTSTCPQAEFKEKAFCRNWAKYLGPLTEGSVYHYYEEMIWDTYQGNTGWHLRGMVNRTVLVETPWNVFDIWTEPFQTSWSGETTYLQSNMPGVSSAKQHFAGLQAQRLSDDTWTWDVSQLSGFNANPDRWAQSSVTWSDAEGYNFDIWTKG